MKALFNYLTASQAELAKVAWPNRRQTIRLTLMVIAFSLVFATFLGGIDYVFSTVLQKLIIKG